MICEKEMSLASGRKQLKKVMTECPVVENSKEWMQLYRKRAPPNGRPTERWNEK